MSAYLYPELKSKKAYKEAIAAGQTVTAREQFMGMEKPVQSGTVTFKGPHYPKPHQYYGTAVVKDGKVVKVS